MIPNTLVHNMHIWVLGYKRFVLEKYPLSLTLFLFYFIGQKNVGGWLGRTAIESK